LYNDHGHEDSADSFWKNALWTKSIWVRIAGIILSISYWALILFGIQTYITLRLFEGLMGYYLKTSHPEWYDDITKIAREKTLPNWMVRSIWSNNYEEKNRYKGMYVIMFSYLGIAFILWIIIGIF
jgi:hypothetical protein